ncbi:hypothetical protein [Amycolatopsis sp. BJA-103]|uniref:hypothetical protein n=1 Tax=unclassified Amycolatopsis TaxID=2618356 RepID=UPI000C7803CE|nr:hypothetical protein [Amycolatopsis sp. BJA-103]AUI64950.1 hypothetical protein BKN51_37160 [Amycolatopsis sp. BJA-103]PNE19703.1 hypothetical protein B1H26_14865 [Amycolatopsis sp. BJA-103]
MVDASKFTAEVFGRAAARPDVPPRLARAADCVREGKFSWEEVASGNCEHPLAQALFAPRAQEKLWPLLAEVAAELESAPAPAAPPRRARRAPATDDDFSEHTYLEDLAEPNTHPAWPQKRGRGR